MRSASALAAVRRLSGGVRLTSSLEASSQRAIADDDARRPASGMQPLKRILMSRPTHFDVKYAINPWMDTRRPVDTALAQRQWQNLKSTIETAGAQVEVLEPKGADDLPDLVFCANAATIRNKTAYLSNFHHAERQGERAHYKQWFEANGYKTVGSTEFAFEGEDRSWLIMGVGPRTDVRALADVHEQLSAADESTPFKVYGMPLVDPRFYHIDTCFCPLTERLALYYPGAFDAVARHNLGNELELIAVSEADASRFACNAVVVGRTVILNEGSEQTARDLERVGFSAAFVNMSEMIKGGGSSKCCTLELL